MFNGKMRKQGRSVSFCLAFLTSIFLASSAQAGAWVHDPYKFYTQLDFSYYQASKFFNRNGDKKRIGLASDPSIPSSALAGLNDSTYKQYEGSLYIEFGLPMSLEFVASLPFFRLAQQDSTIGLFETSGLADPTLGLKYQAYSNDWIVLSGEVDVGIPVGDENAMGSVAGQKDQPIPNGDGEWDCAIRVLGSHSFDAIQSYVSADIGYRFRTKGGSVDFFNDIPWSVEGGYTFDIGEYWFPTMTTFLAFRGILSTRDTSISTLASLTATGNVPSQEFIDIQPGFSLNIYGPVSLVSSFGYTIAGKNTGAGWNVRSGLSFEN